jgi:pimeloyl-ACP methyl ester carboxylesterase
MMERRHILLGGLRLSYLEAGEPAPGRPTLLLLHGLMGCAATFRSLLRELEPSGLHMVALDLPGAGESERRKDIDASLDASATYLARFIAALNLENPILLGHSHGGAVALQATSWNPNLPQSLILIAPAHPYFDEDKPVIRFYLSLPGRLLAYSMPWFPRWVQMIGLRRMAGPQSWDAPERLRPYRENLRVRGTMSHLLRLLRSWKRDMADLRTLMRRPIATPCLILWGDADRAVPVRSAMHLRRHLETSVLQILPHVGHRPAEERPVEVASLITRWIANGPAAFDTTLPDYGWNSSRIQSRRAAPITSRLEPGDWAVPAKK